ncbi:hypothetical protein OAA06_01470 [bacterium]|nr:hypothetical protein [bacterium]
MKFILFTILLSVSTILSAANFETAFMIKEKDKTISEPSEGQSKIVFYRDDFKDANNCCFVDIYMDGAFCGQLRKQQFIEFDCSPGDHDLIFKYWINETMKKDKSRLFNFGGKQINTSKNGTKYIKIQQIAKFTNNHWYDFNHILKYGNVQLDSTIDMQVVKDYYINQLNGNEYVYENDILYEIETTDEFNQEVGDKFLNSLYSPTNINKIKDKCKEGRSVWFLPPTYEGIQVVYHKTEASYLLGLSSKKVDSGKAKGDLSVGAIEMSQAIALKVLKRFKKVTLPISLSEEMRLSLSDFHNHEQWNSQLQLQEVGNEANVALQGKDNKAYFVNYVGDKRDYYKVSLLEEKAWKNFAKSTYMGILSRAASEEVKNVAGLESELIFPDGKKEKGSILGSIRVY